MKDLEEAMEGGLEEMKRKDLQVLCKTYAIKANQKNVDLIQALKEYYNEHKMEKEGKPQQNEHGEKMQGKNEEQEQPNQEKVSDESIVCSVEETPTCVDIKTDVNAENKEEEKFDEEEEEEMTSAKKAAHPKIEIELGEMPSLMNENNKNAENQTTSSKTDASIKKVDSKTSRNTSLTDEATLTTSAATATSTSTGTTATVSTQKKSQKLKYTPYTGPVPPYTGYSLFTPTKPMGTSSSLLNGGALNANDLDAEKACDAKPPPLRENIKSSGLTKKAHEKRRNEFLSASKLKSAQKRNLARQQV